MPYLKNSVLNVVLDKITYLSESCTVNLFLNANNADTDHIVSTAFIWVSDGGFPLCRMTTNKSDL